MEFFSSRGTWHSLIGGDGPGEGGWGARQEKDRENSENGGGRTRRTGGTEGAGRRKRLEGVGDLEGWRKRERRGRGGKKEGGGEALDKTDGND